jgi:hypothetical protein
MESAAPSSGVTYTVVSPPVPSKEYHAAFPVRTMMPAAAPPSISSGMDADRPAVRRMSSTTQSPVPAMVSA